MLGNNDIVVVAYDNLQFAFQISCLADEAGLGIALRVVLWRTHIALAIHHLVPFPVDDGTTGNADLEHIGIVRHQRDGHESAERPSVHTDFVGVDIRQALQIFHLKMLFICVNVLVTKMEMFL